MNWLRQHRIVASALAGYAALVIIAFFAGGGGSAPAAPTPTSEAESTSGSPTALDLLLGRSRPATDRPEVPSVDCKMLLTQDMVDVALGLSDRPISERSTLGTSRGEVCSFVLASDEQFLVRIEPGGPSDLLPTTELFGVLGQPVAGIGDQAFWYGGPGSDGDGLYGVLVVAHSNDLGVVHFRLVLGRPDLDSAAQIEVARTVVVDILPRFPGAPPQVSPPPPRDDEGLRAAFEEPAVDRSAVSFVDNLLAKEDSGEWTRGEGLVATLRYFADEVGGADVLRHGEIQQKEGTGIVKLAIEYLDGPAADPSTRDEITRLLSLFVFNNEDLEAMAGISDASVQRSNQPISFRSTRQPIELCGNMFHGNISPGVGTCLEWRPANVPAGLDENKYRVFIPAPELPQAGWTERDYDDALTAMEFSAIWFEAHGQMPPVNMVFSVSPGGPALATAVALPGLHCAITLFPALQAASVASVQQTIAHELAHCFQTETFTAQNKVDYEIVKWREEGLADYLSNLIYPQNNDEWGYQHPNTHLTRGHTFFDQAYANSLFFQYLEHKIGQRGILSLVAGLTDKGGRAEQEASLAAFPNMKQLLIGFAEAMLDGNIADTGGGTVPFTQTYGTKAITGPAAAELEFRPFGIGRIQYTVEQCKRAHFSFDRGPVLDSARPESSTAWSDLPDVFPRGPDDDHDRLYTVVSIEQVTVTLEVTDVDDDPECDEDTPPEEPEDCRLDCPPSDFYY